MKNIDKYYQFLSAICENLDMEVPTIRFDESHFSTKTQRAVCHVKDKIIYLRRKSQYGEIDYDTLFCIAHEARHIWQFQFPEWKEIIMNRPKASNVYTQDYNLQLHEIDANAYGAVVMIKTTGHRPVFNGLSDDVIQMICDRVDNLISDYKN